MGKKLTVGAILQMVADENPDLRDYVENKILESTVSDMAKDGTKANVMNMICDANTEFTLVSDIECALRKFYAD